MATLCDILEAIKNRVCGTTGIEELCNGWTGAVDQSTWDSLEPAIDATAADITAIFSLVPPTYTPTDAGDENATYDASSKSTDVIGDEACAIATQAWIDGGCEPIDLGEKTDEPQ